MRAFERTLVSSSERETRDIASRLGGLLAPGDLIALTGELGSGKTTFTRGLASGLGLTESRVVSSPTYVLEQVYPARVSIRHYDAYRLQSAEEFAALGFEEHLKVRQCVMVVEWAEKVGSLLPPETLWVDLAVWGVTPPPGGSSLRVIGQGPAALDADALPCPGDWRRIVVRGEAAAWEPRLSRLFLEGGRRNLRDPGGRRP